jgi:hypothetical protein
MKIQIKSMSGSLLFECDAERMVEAIYAAVKANANLTGANLTGAKNSEFAIASTRICPDGEIIGWKKRQRGVLVKLLIPANAKRTNAFGRKCRCEFAKVLEVIGAEVGISEHDSKTEYRVGETVRPDRWEEDFTQECAPGIHFYITRMEAENNQHERT